MIDYGKMYGDRVEPVGAARKPLGKAVVVHEFPAGMDLRDQARAYTGMCMTVLATIAQSEESSDSNKLSAVKELLDRGYGKSAQSLEVTRGADDYSRMSLEQLEAMESRLMAQMPVVVEGEIVE